MQGPSLTSSAPAELHSLLNDTINLYAKLEHVNGIPPLSMVVTPREFTDISAGINQVRSNIRDYRNRYKSDVNILYDIDRLDAYSSHLRQYLSQWISTWVNELNRQIDSQYDNYDIQSKSTNLGRVDFKKHRIDQSIMCIKWSDYVKASSENPLREAAFYTLTSSHRHPCMLPVYFQQCIPQWFVMCTPYTLGTDLFSFIKSQPGPSRLHAKDIFTKLVYGLDYLHNYLGITHLDLKPENVFLHGDLTPVLADFGMSRVIRYPECPNNNKDNNKMLFIRSACITNTVDHFISTHADQPEQISCDELGPFYTPYQTYNHLITDIQYQRSLPYSVNNQPSPGSPEWLMYPWYDLTSQVNSLTYFDLDNTSTRIEDTAIATQPYYALFLDEFISATYNITEITEDIMIPYRNDPNVISTFLNYGLTSIRENLENNNIVMNIDSLYVGFLSNLPPWVYSRLSPDRSCLAIRGINESLGTRAYQAPELVMLSREKSYYDPFKADIYSLGIILFIMIFQFQPYKDPFTTDPAYKIFSEQGLDALIRAYGKTQMISRSAIELIHGMTYSRFTDRFNIKQVIAYLDKLEM